MVTALSDMFRLSLTKSHSSYIRVAQEMEYVRSYLVLQQFRYEDCLSVSITIPDTVAELYIPRFTLQPLVENAIKHGMISPDDPFAIDLEIFIREHTLHIRIGNDGTRISLEQMKKLLDFDASRQELLDFDQKSYGVQNIQRRIQILCGISYGLSYEIRNNRTWCDLTLPVLEHDPSEKDRGFAIKEALTRSIAHFLSFPPVGAFYVYNLFSLFLTSCLFAEFRKGFSCIPLEDL